MADLREQLNAIAEKVCEIVGHDGGDRRALIEVENALRALAAQPAPAGEVAVGEWEISSMQFLAGELRKRGDSLSVDSASWLEKFTNLRASAAVAQAGVPEGYALVPKVATGKMLAEARKRGRGLEECWAIMVELAPTAPQPQAINSYSSASNNSFDADSGHKKQPINSHPEIPDNSVDAQVAQGNACACGLSSCVEAWEPGCGLGNSEAHVTIVPQAEGKGEADARTIHVSDLTKGLFDWLNSRELVPEIDEAGTISVDDLIVMLDTHEAELQRAEPAADAEALAEQAKISDLLHLLQFATITTPTEGDAEQAMRIMSELRVARRLAGKDRE